MRGIYFKVTFPSLLFGTRVSSSLCRKADVDPQSEMDAVGGGLVELPAGQKRSNVPPACKGKEGEDRGATRAALKDRHQSPL